MIHEEKALYLSQKYGAPKNKNREIAIYQSTIEMAEWKDKQFKEYLERKREDADDCDDGITSCVITEIIKELFGKD